MAILLATNGPEAGRQYELSARGSVLGRHPECDIVIEVGAVSRRHAQISRIGPDYFVEDLESRNGTFLNEQPVVGQMRLKENDLLRICDITFSFHLAPPPDETPSLTGSTRMPILFDDEQRPATQTIMSTLDVSTRTGIVQLAASAETKLKALVEITQSLAKAVSVDAVLPQVLNSLFKIFIQADRGFIVLRSQDGRLIPRWTKLRREKSDDTIRVSRTIINKVMESKGAILSADAASDTRFEMSQSIADFQIRSMMCAPLVDSDGRAIGALQIDTLDQRHRFQAEDLEVLASVASQAAIAIDNAQLHEQALRQRAIERDLELAHQVQRGFLPERPVKLVGYEFFDFYRPANKVGGDYFDYIELPGGRVAVLVADVVGHGVAAALLMAKLAAQVRFCLASQSQAGAVLSQLNDLFMNGNLDDRFVTLAIVMVDPQRHEVTIANAGHMNPLLRLATGQVVELSDETSGVPLGVMKDAQYEQCSVVLEPGQVLAIYTDGISEAMDAADQFYGTDRLRQQMAGTTGGPETLGRSLIASVDKFIGARPQNDDMCLVTFGRM